jgi:hypothetical protein
VDGRLNYKRQNYETLLEEYLYDLMLGKELFDKTYKKENHKGEDY